MKDSTSYLETHYEITAFIESSLMSSERDCKIWEVYNEQGRGGMYELSKEWTDEFEEMFNGFEWDGEFFDIIDQFCFEKSEGLTPVKERLLIEVGRSGNV